MAGQAPAVGVRRRASPAAWSGGAADTVNPKIATGEVEVVVRELVL